MRPLPYSMFLPEPGEPHCSGAFVYFGIFDDGLGQLADGGWRRADWAHEPVPLPAADNDNLPPADPPRGAA